MRKKIIEWVTFGLLVASWVFPPVEMATQSAHTLYFTSSGRPSSRIFTDHSHKIGFLFGGGGRIELGRLFLTDLCIVAISYGVLRVYGNPSRAENSSENELTLDTKFADELAKAIAEKEAANRKLGH